MIFIFTCCGQNDKFCCWSIKTLYSIKFTTKCGVISHLSLSTSQHDSELFVFMEVVDLPPRHLTLALSGHIFLTPVGRNVKESITLSGVPLTSTLANRRTIIMSMVHPCSPQFYGRL